MGLSWKSFVAPGLKEAASGDWKGALNSAVSGGISTPINDAGLSDHGIKGKLGQTLTGGNIVDKTGDVIGLKEDNFFRSGGVGGGIWNGADTLKNEKAEEILTATNAAEAEASSAQTQASLNAMAVKYGIDPKSLINYHDFAGDPAKMTAAITRAELQNNQDTYYPIEDALFNQTSYNNPNIASQGIAEAIGNGSITRNNFITETTDGWLNTGVGRKRTSTHPAGGYVQGALDNAYNQQQRNFQRYGMNASTRQQSAIDNNDTMKRSTAVADAANKVRANIVDRDNQILMGN